MGMKVPYDIGSLVQLKDGMVCQVKSYRITPFPVRARLIVVGSHEERLVELPEIAGPWEVEEA
jgi:hypothetical protein